ncbi:MAG: hypothetical protein WCF90_05395 [Methanomicrobiales archaeon]
MAPSQASLDYKVNFSFYHTAQSPINASQREFFIHIVTDPGLMKNPAMSQASTSRSERGEIPTNCSFSIAKPTANPDC